MVDDIFLSGNPLPSCHCESQGAAPRAGRGLVPESAMH